MKASRKVMHKRNQKDGNQPQNGGKSYAQAVKGKAKKQSQKDMSQVAEISGQGEFYGFSEDEMFDIVVDAYLKTKFGRQIEPQYYQGTLDKVKQAMRAKMAARSGEQASPVKQKEGSGQEVADDGMELEEKETHRIVTSDTQMNLDADQEQESGLEDIASQQRKTKAAKQTGQTKMDQFITGATETKVELPDGAVLYKDYMTKHGKMTANMKYKCSCSKYPNGLAGNRVGSHIKHCKSVDQAYIIKSKND